MIKLLFFVYALLLSTVTFDQKKNAAFQLHIFPTSEKNTIDGIANETVWKNAEVAKDFFMVLPMDTSLAKVETEVEMTYDKTNLYLLAKSLDAPRKDEIVESLRRDWNFLNNDNFIVFIDPFVKCKGIIL